MPIKKECICCKKKISEKSYRGQCFDCNFPDHIPNHNLSIEEGVEDPALLHFIERLFSPEGQRLMKDTLKAWSKERK